MNLKKHKGTSKDNKGCEFHYTAYRSFDYGFNKNGEFKEKIVESLYIDNHGFGLKATSLNELKKLISKIGD